MNIYNIKSLLSVKTALLAMLICANSNLAILTIADWVEPKVTSSVIQEYNKSQTELLNIFEILKKNLHADRVSLYLMDNQSSNSSSIYYLVDNDASREIDLTQRQSLIINDTTNFDILSSGNCITEEILPIKSKDLGIVQRGGSLFICPVFNDTVMVGYFVVILYDPNGIREVQQNLKFYSKVISDIIT